MCQGALIPVGEDITRFEVDHDIAWVLIVEKEVWERFNEKLAKAQEKAEAKLKEKTARNAKKKLKLNGHSLNGKSLNGKSVNGKRGSNDQSGAVLHPSRGAISHAG